MATFNPYAMDPTLAGGFNNLSQALLGNAASDNALKQGNLIDQQVLTSQAQAAGYSASGRASDALAKQRAAETVGATVQSDRMAQLFAQVDPDNVNPLLETALMNAMGFKGTIDQNGNVVETVGPNDPLMSVPMKGAAGGNLTRTGMGTDVLMSLLVGDGTYNPDSMSNALTNLGDGRLSAMAKSMILNGTSGEKTSGALMLSPQGGKYQNPEFAASELEETLKAETAQSAATDAARLDGTRYTADSVESSATKLTNAKIVWQEYKTKQERLANDYATDQLLVGTKDRNDRTFELGKYKHDNRTVELSVGLDQVITVDPASGIAAGITPNAEGLYQIKGARSPNSVSLRVGQADMWVDEAQATALGIPQNAAGQYIVEGSGYATGNGNGKPDFSFENQWKKDLMDFTPEGEDTFPLSVVGIMRTKAIESLRAGMKREPGLTGQEAYTKFMMPVITEGTIKMGGMVNAFRFPKYYFDRLVKAIQINKIDNAELKIELEGFGYSESQQGEIYDLILKRAKQ